MKPENENMNIPSVSVDELVQQLLTLYAGAISAGMPLRALPTPFLWGPAGIGKSDGVRQLAARLEEKTGKQVTVTDVRLLLFSPVDLRGVPMADEHRRFTDWLRPRIFDMDPDGGTINLLFLDELSAAPQSVQAAAYQITLDRRVGEHMLPENCLVIAAGNRTTDQSISYKMPKALCNRLMHYNVRSDFASWKRWAIAHGVDPRITGYLAFDNSKLCAEPESSDLAYPTPRSWSFVSSVLAAAGGSGADLRALHQPIAACVGVDTALAFRKWCQLCNSLPSIEAILQGRNPPYPRTHDGLYALSAGMISAAAGGGESMRVEELDNLCAYAARFPADFAMSFFKDLNQLEHLRLKLMRCPALQTWLSKNKKYI